MRSSKAPPNQKKIGAIFTPTHPNPPELASEPASCYARRGIIDISRENQRLVTNEQIEFEDNRLNFETSGELPFILEESIEYMPI